MKRYKRNTDNISSKINEEVVMVNAKKGNYFTLNAVGSRIWDIIVTPMSIEEVCDVLVTEFDIDQDTCTREVTEFIEKCKDLGVIDMDEK